MATATPLRKDPAGRTLEEVLCFPNEACYRPGMSVAQHESEKQLWIQHHRDPDQYRAYRLENPYPAEWPPETPPESESGDTDSPPEGKRLNPNAERPTDNS
jgi:hypothetical protein